MQIVYLVLALILTFFLGFSFGIKAFLDYLVYKVNRNLSKSEAKSLMVLLEKTYL